MFFAFLLNAAAAATNLALYFTMASPNVINLVCGIISAFVAIWLMVQR